MEVYFGLGSNLGDRLAHLEAALRALEHAGARDIVASPTVESPALLPAGAPASWNRPYLNLVARARIARSEPDDWHRVIKSIETRLGRDLAASRWSPRPVDIDILLWGRRTVRTERLTIPHPEIRERSFVLTPLAHLAPLMAIPGHGDSTVLEWAGRVRPIPLWMGIVNCTPDSFSGGGAFDPARLAAAVDEQVAAGVHWIDLGAESTRPGAWPVSPEEEWRRLEAPLREVIAHLRGARLPPGVSVDTRHPEVAERALVLGAQMVNDVSGLGTTGMRRLARESGAEWVAVHAVSVPADPGRRLPPRPPAPDTLVDWLARRRREWEDDGLDPARILFDPGIGFGKDSLQALDLFAALDRFRAEGFRVLVGHSRKVWFAGGGPPAPERDPETLGASLALAARGVEVLRVHDVALHARAYRSWAHVAEPPPAPSRTGGA
ncbi:MAG: dihydropteroate synthase [Immundisolibacterales bacterium]|nr:dihydropteroate synthase [Immundisolibacterales bacterium]